MIVTGSGIQIRVCPGLNVKGMYTFHDGHHDVSSLMKVRQNTHNDNYSYIFCQYGNMRISMHPAGTAETILKW